MGYQPADTAGISHCYGSERWWKTTERKRMTALNTLAETANSGPAKNGS